MRYQFLRFPGGKPKALTFSYDDGCPQDLRLADVLSAHGMKGTFNFNSDAYRGSEAFSKELVESHFWNRGHEIAIHGAIHRAEGAQRPIEGIQDVLNCRLELEQRFDRIIRGMAYPDWGIKRMANGATYENIKRYLTDLDIAYARALDGDNDKFELPTDWHAWMPSAHHTNPEILRYVDAFLAIELNNPYYQNGRYHANRYPRLLYIWGHSYEFDRNNNWELLDTICEKLENKEDIWYATNIEICDYVRAYQSLCYSADGAIIHNPTATTIWFERDAKPYKIEPGETLKFF